MRERDEKARPPPCCVPCTARTTAATAHHQPETVNLFRHRLLSRSLFKDRHREKEKSKSSSRFLLLCKKYSKTRHAAQHVQRTEYRPRRAPRVNTYLHTLLCMFFFTGERPPRLPSAVVLWHEEYPW